jgi:hypothetical protein
VAAVYEGVKHMTANENQMHEERLYTPLESSVNLKYIRPTVPTMAEGKSLKKNMISDLVVS